MTLEDRELHCIDCQQAFVFTVGEQEFFVAKGLKNEPKRCPGCRLATRLSRAGRSLGDLSEVQCAQCGKTARVPFKPKGYRPVLCNECLAVKRSSPDTGESQLSEAEAPADATVVIR